MDGRLLCGILTVEVIYVETRRSIDIGFAFQFK